jgi:galactokinase
MIPADQQANGLVQAGMSDQEAASKARLLALCHRALDELGAGKDRTVLYVPGRVEFLGKHTDYAGGRSLLCATERGMCLVASRREDNILTVRDVVEGVNATFAIAPDLDTNTGDWSGYVRNVARRLAGNFPDTLAGADIAFGSDLPRAAGLSSSSVLTTGLFLVLAELNQLKQHARYQDNIRTPGDCAEYLGSVENGNAFRGLAGDAGVGTMGGSQDHTAILLSEPHCLVQYRFLPLRHETTVRLPESHVFVIAASGVAAEKTGAARERYNRGARLVYEIQQICEHALGQRYPSLISAATSNADAHDAIRDAIRQATSTVESTLLARLEQVMMESTVLVPDAVQALRIGDLRRVAEIVALSQLLAERLLENQIPETVALVRLARDLGAVAASAFGAGFGGSVWALVPEGRANTFREEWVRCYAHEFPDRIRNADFFVSRAGPPAVFLDGGGARPAV